MQIQVPSRVKVGEYRVKQDGHELQTPLQLGLPFYGKSFSVEGMTDAKYGEQIRYIGRAVHVFDTTYRCLAAVGGALCVVEVTIRPHDDVPPSSGSQV